jgi:lipopolysaccharide export LptBFGC system permease protein LptF
MVKLKNKKREIKEMPRGEILSEGLHDINKIHRNEMEERRDRKLHSKISGLFHAILMCVIFAAIIFFNLSSYQSQGFRLFMIVLLFVFIIAIPILAVIIAQYYSRMKRQYQRI